MTKKDRGQRFERVMLWAMFILPAIHGCIVWIRQPTFPVEHAYLSWLFSAAFAVLLMLEYHRRPPKDR